jgi:EF hand
MKRRFPILTASALILASGISLAQAQQSTEDQQGQGMMGSDMGMTPETMQQERMGMGPSMMGRHGPQSGMMGPGMRGHGGMMGHGGMLRIMFAIMDADGDGALALGEVQDIHARIFTHIDADKNGKVTPEEIQAFFRGTEAAAASLGTQEGAAQQAQPQAAEGMQVTGMVTEADQQTREITIDDQTYVMPAEGGGASLFPQVGAEITLFYKEESGQKVITRIGQKEE